MFERLLFYAIFPFGLISGFTALYSVCHNTEKKPSQLGIKYDQINEILSDMKGWNNNMEFNLSPSPQDESKYIDLCTILKGKKPLELPQHFDGISGKNKLITALKMSAIKSGFGLVHRSSKSVKNLEKSQSSMAAYLTL